MQNLEPGLARKVLDSTKTSIIDFFLQGRGERGVFDLEELVDILKGEKVAKNPLGLVSQSDFCPSCGT